VTFRLEAWDSIPTVARGAGAPGMVARRAVNASQDRLPETIGKHTNATSGRVKRMRSTSKEITGSHGLPLFIGEILRFLPKTECEIVQVVQVSSISWVTSRSQQDF